MAITAWIWLICSSRLKSLAASASILTDLGGLVGDGDLDELVQLLVDASFKECNQPLPRDVGTAAAAQLLDLAKLIERVLIFRLDGIEPLELGGFDPAFLGAHHGELGLGQLLELGEIGFDDLVKIGRPQGPVAHAGQQRIGPGLEQLLAMARKLQLPLQLLMRDARAAEKAMGLRHAPISERRRRQGHGEQQARGNQELGLIAHVCLVA